MDEKGGNWLTAPNSLPSLLRWLPSFLVALLVAGPAAAETLSLKPGESLEREIRGGETLSFDLPLSAGTFLGLEIAQRDVSLSPRLLDPAGRLVAAGGGSGTEILALITDREGTYQLRLAAPESRKYSKRFAIRLLDLRPAGAGDADRVRGARTLAAARDLLTRGGREAQAKAEALITGSIEAWRTAGDARGEIEALLEGEGLRRDRGDLPGALVWQDRALELARASGYAEDEARALAGKGAYQMKLGRHDEAIDAFRKSWDLLRRTGGAYEQASALQRLGRAYDRKKDYEEAGKTFAAALEFAEASGDLPQQARALSGLGASRYNLGHPDEAREIWNRAVALTRQGGDDATEALAEMNLAVLHHNQGQFQQALELYTNLARRASPQDPGLLHSNIGNLYMELGDPRQALENYERARAAYHASGDVENEVNALVNVGRARQQMGDLGAALADFETARRMPLPQAPWGVFNSLGQVQVDLGKPQEALPSLQKALEIAETTGDRSRKVATLLVLSSAYTRLGQAGAAAASLQQAIDLGSEIGYQSAVSLALLRRALLWEGKGRLEDALADVQKAVEGLESTRRTIPGDQLRIGFFASKRIYYDLEIDLLMRLDRLHPGTYRGRALEASERARARGLLDLLAEGRIDLSPGLDSDLRRQEEDLAFKVSQVQRELRAGRATPERIRELQARLGQLDQERAGLDLTLRARNRRYADIRYPVPLKLDQIQALLSDDGTALLEYALGARSSTLFVVTRKGLEAYELPGADVIRQRVERLRNALEKNSLLTRQEYFDQGFQLYRDLLLPASEALAGKTSLLIAADGVLNYVPFEALLTEPAGGRPFQDLPYLLRRFSVAYVPSASVLASLREPRQEPAPAGRKEVVAFAPFAAAGGQMMTQAPPRGTGAAPSPETARWSFAPLPASRQEVGRIAGLYPSASLSFIGSAANEDAVTHDPAVSGARRLHFATHASIDEHFPERSALVMAERPGEDGLLDVPEIFNLKLSADLAVLSACQTGLGKEVTGEGLVGLSRAFFYAGVPSLVVSLWNVVDGPTPDLMGDFYQALDHLGDKAKALQAAKLSMISRAAYAHPSYWAPFILLGEPH